MREMETLMQEKNLGYFLICTAFSHDGTFHKEVLAFASGSSAEMESCRFGQLLSHLEQSQEYQLNSKTTHVEESKESKEGS